MHAVRKLTKTRVTSNQIDYGEEHHYYDLAGALIATFFPAMEDDEIDKIRRGQIAYLARYARVVSHLNALDDFAIFEIRAWMKAVSDIVKEENAPSTEA